MSHPVPNFAWSNEHPENTGHDFRFIDREHAYPLEPLISLRNPLVRLGRAWAWVRATLRDQFPDLAAVVPPEDFGGEEGVYAWLAEQVVQFGETRDVAPLKPEDHTRINPFTEFSIVAPQAEVIVFEVPDGGDGD